MIKYILLFLLLMQPSAIALDKDRPIKQKVGVVVDVHTEETDKVHLYYKLEKETEDYILNLLVETSLNKKDQQYKVKIEVEF